MPPIGTLSYVLGGVAFLLLVMATLVFSGVSRARLRLSGRNLSRDVVLHGFQLLLFAVLVGVVVIAAGLLQRHTGRWGTILQIALVVVSTVVLTLLLLSRDARSRMRVFVDKHFLSFRYDYRQEWQRLIATMSSADGEDVGIRTIRALAELMNCPGGTLWCRHNGGDYQRSAVWEMSQEQLPQQVPHDQLIGFLSTTGWIIDLDEFRGRPYLYPGLSLPGWLHHSPQDGLVIPLWLGEELHGFVILERSKSPHKLNWEDHDLLKTTGRQLSSYLALVQTGEALARARQFEAFNMLTAYVVHDLKNMVAQLSLIVSNAQRHRHNPEFMNDAISTVEHVSERMSRMLSSLRKGAAHSATYRQRVELREVALQVIAERSVRRPRPELVESDSEIAALAFPDQLATVLGHLVQNAQEATAEAGQVRLRIVREGAQVRIDVIDNGVGMNEAFVRQRLFRPFDTTKGNGGIGIGVYQSRELLAQMGGTLEVESAPGRGSRFSIRLELASARPLAVAGSQPIQTAL